VDVAVWLRGLRLEQYEPAFSRQRYRRAVGAGLGLIDTIGRLDVGSAHLQACVGIATGPMVVGDLIGDGPAQDHAAVRETPNLARPQALAEPDAVVNRGS
jgi:hypothetical protein